MNFALKNIKFYESMSEETNCFQADLFIDGKKRGEVKNDGRGGCTDVRPLYDQNKDKFIENRNAIASAEAYCKTLPKEKFGEHEFQPDLESVVDGLFEEYLKEKADKKFLKDMDKGICYGDKNSYTILFWKGHTLKQLLATPNGITVIRKALQNLKDKNETVLNTNLPKELLT